MNENHELSADITSTDYTTPLGIEIWLDTQCLLGQDHVTDKIKFVCPLSDNDGEHILKIVMKNKTPEHTTIDPNGEILSDACLQIDNYVIDELDITQIMYENSQYTHDFNGSQAMSQNQFWGTMGCNGTVEIKFTTPFYLWFIENM